MVLASVAALGLAVLAGYLVRDRGRAGLSSSSEPSRLSSSGLSSSGQSSSTPAGTGGTTAPTPSARPSKTASCEPGASGPLRVDSQFTATDGKGTAVHYSVSLPDDYYTACLDYPVLYALHGRDQNNVGFLDDALVLRKAMAAGVLDQAIIVTPDSYLTGRWENRDTGPAEDNFITYLIPYIEQNYRVRPGPSHRLLTGFSMGGHGAFRFGLKYPQLFAAVWSVDGAMASPQDYLPFVEGRTTADFHILSVGGQLNGDRVRAVVDALKQHGVEIPYTYQDREHEFRAFVEEDEKAGWVAMKFLQTNLGRPI